MAYRNYDVRAFGQIIQESRSALRSQDDQWTLDYLAQACGVGNKGTMSKIEQGKVGASPAVRQRIIDVLVAGVEQSNLASIQRTYLKDRLTKTVAPQAMSEPRPTQRYWQELAIDGYDHLFEWWGKALYRGESQQVIEDAQSEYEKFLQRPFLTTDLDTVVLVGRIVLWLGNAHLIAIAEASPNVRYRTVANVFTDAQRRVFAPAEKRFHDHPLFAREYSRLLASRSNVNRLLGKFLQTLSDHELAVQYAANAEDKLFHMNSLLEWAHDYAILGVEYKWRAIIEQVMRELNSFRGDMRPEDLAAVVRNHYGEGLKRFAFNPYLPLDFGQRERYAGRGAEALTHSVSQLGNRAFDLFTNHGITGVYPLNMRVGAAQCRLWCDERSRVVDDLQTYREEAERDYPALVDKIDFALQCAHKLVRWNKHTPPPIFDLDTPTKPDTSDAHDVRGHLLGKRAP
jgi:hypothetical protein